VIQTAIRKQRSSNTLPAVAAVLFLFYWQGQITRRAELAKRPNGMASNPGSRSASYTERKNTASQSRKNGVTSSTVERQTEKKTILTRETYNIRSKSPSKRQSDAQAAPKRARDPVTTNARREEKEQTGMDNVETLHLC
jgi:hypothetical protein